jgi:hypothetical protein
MWALWVLVSSFFFSHLSFNQLPKIKEKNHVVGTASIEWGMYGVVGYKTARTLLLWSPLLSGAGFLLSS